MGRWKTRKRTPQRYEKQTTKVYTSHECHICGTHLACYSYDFGKTWYCPEHKERGKVKQTRPSL